MDTQQAQSMDQLQADVLRLLDELIVTVEDAEKDQLIAPVADDRPHSAALRAEADAVRRLELRMPIVAPMKAGKSTLINAIVGHELLPARALAMTTLPTQIELSDTAERPTLRLPTQTQDFFRQLLNTVRPKLPGRRLDELVRAHPHLGGVLGRLNDGRFGDIPAEVVGHGEVQQVLTDINDLVRLAAVVGVPDDTAGSLPQAPVLRTPYRRRPELQESTAQGRLAIVDTPGPDEQGMAPRLTNAVGAELRRSHVVLIVLDYTRMGGEADAKVLKLAEPILDMIGRDKLYVVVNKIDQRSEQGSLPTAELRQLVSSLLDLPDSGPARVFETSAHRALAAARVLTAIDAGVRAEQTADHAAFRSLAELVEPIVRRRARMFTLSITDWREEAQAVWDESGLPELLEGTVTELRRQAMPMVLTSAVAKLQAAVGVVGDAARLRLKAATADRAKVESELNSLRREMVKLENQRAAVPKSGDLMKNLDRHLRGKLDDCRAEASRLIKNLGTDTDDERGFLRGVLSKVFSPLKGRKQRSEGVYAYDEHEKGAAQATLNEINGTATAALRSLLDKARNDMITASAEWTRQRIVEQETAVRPILDSATRRLGVAFDLQLQLPAPEFSAARLDQGSRQPKQEEHQRTRTEIYHEEVRLARYLWFKKGLKERTREVSYVEHTYVVSIPQLRDELNASFKEALNDLTLELQAYVSDDVATQIADYYRRMDAFMTQHQHSLKQVQADWSADDQHRARVQDRVKALAQVVEQHRGQLAALAGQLARGHSA
ncbi:dynamin family protein [Catellatospora citrea]|uniref:Dynamin N-terminal domain-containing protein n=1 Tax=Catellatospora citrea TaxID=53366 RepID=A0A8J3K9K4_9ACTN|nr:dynamin family protein [Catellatospora citrea]RKE11179.1 dynamin family protein [Catellatospora citrea]GIF96644.1 hypothetical protein Cci01nite_17380 [Catellatospora citrea]